MSVLQGTGYAATVTGTSTPAATAGVLTVTAPDGATTTPAVAGAAGTFTAVVPASQIGSYLLVWSLTGAGATQVIQDSFVSVAPSLTLSNLFQVKLTLNKVNDTSKDVQIRHWLREATTVIENICGPIIPKTETYFADGGGSLISLPRRWVASITSVTENWGNTNYTLTEQPLGTGSTNYGYTWDRNTNTLVRRNSSGALYAFPQGVNNVTVVFKAGMTNIPDAIQRATNQMVMHWYNKDAQPIEGNYSRSGDDYPVVNVGAFEVPRAVMEVLQAYRDYSAFA